MAGVFRELAGSGKLGVTVVILCLVLSGCGSEGTPPETTIPPAESIPESLDGFWLLTATDLTIDIDLDTAGVDGRTNCARVLGSLTFEDAGARTSFSLPGRDDTRCSASEKAEVDDLVELLQSVERARGEPGAFVLLDGTGADLGRLTSGA